MLGLVSQFAADGDALTLMLTAVAVMCSSILLPRCTLVADTELKDRLAAAGSDAHMAGETMALTAMLVCTIAITHGKANVGRLGGTMPFVR